MKREGQESSRRHTQRNSRLRPGRLGDTGGDTGGERCSRGVNGTDESGSSKPGAANFPAKGRRVHSSSVGHMVSVILLIPAGAAHKQ